MVARMLLMRKTYTTLIAALVLISMLGFYSYETKIAGGAVAINGGHITENTTWNLSQSPYYIEGDVYVDEGYTLTIEPGVDVRFNGDYGLFIDGNLNAVGSPNKMINFTTNMSAPSNEWDGIQINSTGHANIKYCNITYAICCIHLFYSSNNNITNNNISSSNIYGIYMNNSLNNLVEKNDISGNLQANIYLNSSSNNDIIGNNIFWSNVGYGIDLIYSSNNNIVDNKICFNVHYGVFLQHSSKNKIINNEIYSNGNENIYLTSSSNNNLIINNDIYDSDFGIELSSSSNNTIIGNKIYSHNWLGIFLLGSSYNNITNNNISNNAYGIHIFTDSHHNRIYHNNFMNNPTQALDEEGDNYWDDSYPSGGNYWSDFDEPGEGAHDDYKGPDQNVLGYDSIVDKGLAMGGGKNPYIIDADSQDNYPLIQPFTGNSIYLYEGWNLISIPLIQSNTSIISVLQSIDGKYDAVQRYNSSDKNDPWKHHHISKPSLLNDLNEITHEIGFWVHITTPGGTLFSYDGIRPIQNQTIHLCSGWNLVGYPSLSNKNRTAALNNLTYDVDIDSILTYDATTHMWEEIGPSDYFEIGRGYWVHAKAEKNWDVPL